MNEDWAKTFQDFHAWIDTKAAAESPNNSRPCPLCGVQCSLKLGRHTKKWRWHHPQSGCINARLDKKNWQTDYSKCLEMEMFLTEVPDYNA